MKKKSGFTLVELAIAVLIISCISVVLIIVLRGNLNTMNMGQKHMNFNQKIAFATRRMFYDLKAINPMISESGQFGYSVKGEAIGDAKPRMVLINKYSDGQYEIEFTRQENFDSMKLYRIKFYLKDGNLIREERNPVGKVKTEVIMEKVTLFEADNDPSDIKQIYVAFVASDPENKIKPEKIDFAVRLETDFVCVKKFEDVAR